MLHYLESKNCDTIKSSILSLNTRIVSYLYLGEYDQVDKILSFFESMNVKDSLCRASIESSRGNYFYIQDEYSEALKHFKNTKDLYPKLNKDFGRKNIISIINIARLESELYNIDKSLELYDEGIRYLEKHPDSKMLFSIYNQLGTLSKNQGLFEKAKTYYLNASQVEGISDTDKFIALSNVIRVHYFLKQYDEVITMVEDIIHIEFKKPFTKALLYRNISLAYLQQSDVDNSKKYLKQFEKFADMEKNAIISEMYDRTNASFLAKVGRYAEASKLFETSYHYNDKKNKVNNKKASLKGWLISDISSHDEDLGSRFIVYNEMSDSLYEAKLERSINKWEVKYNTKQKENELKESQFINEKKQSQITQKNRIISAAILSIAVLSFLLFLLRGLYNKLHKVNAELERKNLTLNVLNREMKHRSHGYLKTAINMLTEQRRSSDTDELDKALLKTEKRIRALSSVSAALDRKNLNSKKLDKLITDLIEDLTYKTEKPINKNISIADTQLDNHQIISLALITNELVFNSLKYAFAETTTPEISLSIASKNDKIHYNYSDNGSGMDGTIKGTGEGRQLIADFVTQVHGKASESNDNGYRFNFVFDKALSYA